MLFLNHVSDFYHSDTILNPFTDLSFIFLFLNQNLLELQIPSKWKQQAFSQEAWTLKFWDIKL